MKFILMIYFICTIWNVISTLSTLQTSNFKRLFRLWYRHNCPLQLMEELERYPSASESSAYPAP